MEQLSTSSGISIPLFLKKKWRNQKEREQQRRYDVDITSNNELKQISKGDDSAKEKDNEGNGKNNESLCPQLRSNHDISLTAGETNELSNRVFTAAELEERIWKTKATMIDIQRQLYRGEEIYYEDTYNHGSIFKGWDAFVDTKDIPASATGGVSTQSTCRRVPVDSRWFSSSCKSVSRTTLPSSFPPPPSVPLLARATTATEEISTVPEKCASDSSIRALVVARAPMACIATTVTEIKNESVRSEERPYVNSTSTAASEILYVTKPENPKKILDAKIKDDSAIKLSSTSTKKKRKSTTCSEDPHAKKVNQLIPSIATSADEELRKIQISTSGNIDNSINNNIDAMSVYTSSKNEKDEGTPPVPVPRKRGRPRRKN